MDKASSELMDVTQFQAARKMFDKLDLLQEQIIKRDTRIAELESALALVIDYDLNAQRPEQCDVDEYNNEGHEVMNWRSDQNRFKCLGEIAVILNGGSMTFDRRGNPKAASWMDCEIENHLTRRCMIGRIICK